MIEALLVITLIALPSVTSDFMLVIATRMVILALLAISFDLCWGYSGIMSFGQALYFGVSGYVVALLANKAGFVNIFGVVPIGMLVGLVVAFLVSWFLLLGKRTPTIIFVALGTLTASYAAERLVAGWQWVGAGNGMSVWEFPRIFDYELEPGLVFYIIACTFLVIVYLASRFLVRSQFGLVLAGMRQNEERLAFFGYKVQRFKAMVFAFAGMIAGLSGALYTYHEGFVGPGNLGIVQSTNAVLYALFGGAGTLVGAIVGTGVIETASFFLADQDVLKPYWPIVLGVLMLVVVAYKPTGLLGFFISQRERFGSFGMAPGAGRGSIAGSPIASDPGARARQESTDGAP